MAKTERNCKKEFNHPFSLEEGFATFFLNITNVSGITSGGQIEGTKQESKYKVGCCFNKQSLIKNKGYFFTKRFN